MRRFARFVAIGFGSGAAPLIPGTVGTFVALLIGAGLLRLSPWALPLAALVATFGGLWAVARGEIAGDPGWVVIDEFAGQFITMLALDAPSLRGLFAAFVLFRLIDVSKPGPVGWADRQKNAAGIMADDVFAGAIAAGILWAVQQRWPHLLVGGP